MTAWTNIMPPNATLTLGNECYPIYVEDVTIDERPVPGAPPGTTYSSVTIHGQVAMGKATTIYEPDDDWRNIDMSS